VKGFDETLWTAALDEAGYAKGPLPGQRLGPAPQPQRADASPSTQAPR